jgi:hypothetical protein
MGIIYIDKCRYEIQEYKEVPVWCTGMYWPISGIAHQGNLTFYYINCTFCVRTSIDVIRCSFRCF